MKNNPEFSKNAASRHRNAEQQLSPNSGTFQTGRDDARLFGMGRALHVALGFLLFFIFTAQAEKQTLNLFIWSEYIDQKIVAQFETQFDCKVNIDLYEDVESMLAKVQGAGAGLYDVVVPSDNLVPVMIKQNLLSTLRHENVPNLKNLGAKFSSPAYDPTNRFTAAYQWGTLGLLVRKTPGQPLPDSWAAVFDEKKSAGSFMLIDSVRDQMGAALKYQGHSVNSVAPAELKAARDLCIAAKARCVGFDGSVGVKNKILGKTARVGLVYSGEAVRALSDDKETAYIIPKEGSVIWVDNLAVLAKAPHRELAEKFINFILDAKIGAQLSDYTQFATPNEAARAFIKPEDLKNAAIYPSPEVMARLEFLNDLGPKLRLYDEAWTEIKTR